ncbi:cystatin-13-like [Fukomys damarensis]|uniref:cystatin-13-like n=1 Tax=Fukomys damarensis TaxID=885580 RepID=UPI00053FA560|nr:cystatin-13-like [Fukomys damarensis]
MAKLCRALLLLIVTVAFELSRVQAWGSPKVVRSFQDISPSYVYVQQAVWYAMKEFYRMSFMIFYLLILHWQVTDSLEYYFEAKIARTMCKKAAGENEHCLFQKNPTMQKEVFCIFVVRSKPWKFELSMLKKLCRDA